MSSLKQQISLIHTKNLGDIKGTQPAMGPCWPGHYLLSVEKRLLQPKLIKYTLRIHSRDKFRNPLQSCIVFDSILDLWMIPSFRANFYPSCNIILPASMQRNMKRIDLYKCATSDFGFAKKKNYHHHSTLLRRWFPNLPCLAYFDGTSRWVFPASFSRW